MVGTSGTRRCKWLEMEELGVGRGKGRSQHKRIFRRERSFPTPPTLAAGGRAPPELVARLS